MREKTPFPLLPDAAFPAGSLFRGKPLVFLQSVILVILLLNTAEAVSALASGSELVFLAALAFPLFAAAAGLLAGKKSLPSGPARPGFWLDLAVFFLLFPLAFFCSFPAERIAGKTGWNLNFSTLSLSALCLILFWSCAGLLRRMRNFSPAGRESPFPLPMALGAACGCYLYFFQTVPLPLIVPPLLAMQFLLAFSVFAPQLRIQKTSALLTGIHAVWCFLALCAAVCLGVCLMSASGKKPLPRRRAGGAPLEVRVEKDSFRLFRGGTPVGKRSVSRYSNPGGRLPVLAVLLQNYRGKPLKIVSLVSLFSPLPLRLDVFRSMIEKNTVILSPYSPPAPLPAAFQNIKTENTKIRRGSAASTDPAAGCDIMFIDLPRPHHFGSNFFFTFEFLSSLRKSLNPGGLLALRIPRTGESAPDLQCEADLRATASALSPDSLLLSGEEDSFFLIPADARRGEPAPELSTNSTELGRRLKQYAPPALAERFLEPLTLVLPLWETERRTNASPEAPEGAINTVETPVLFDVFPGGPVRSGVFSFFAKHRTLLLILCLAAYFLCRYFIAWSPLHKPCFQAFETGFFLAGLPALLWFRGQLFGAGLDFRRFALDWSLFLFLLSAASLFRGPARRFLTGAALFPVLLFLIYPFPFPAGETRAGLFFTLPAFVVASVLIRFDWKRAAPVCTSPRAFAFLAGNGFLGGACACFCAALTLFPAAPAGFPVFPALLLLIALLHLPFPFREALNP